MTAEGTFCSCITRVLKDQQLKELVTYVTDVVLCNAAIKIKSKNSCQLPFKGQLTRTVTEASTISNQY